MAEHGFGVSLPGSGVFDQATNVFGNNGFLDPLALEETALGRRSLFESFRPQNLQTPFQQNAFSSMFDRVFNNFLGGLGSQIRGGQAPTNTFASHLSNLNLGRQSRRFGSANVGGTSQFRSPGQFVFDQFSR